MIGPSQSADLAWTTTLPIGTGYAPPRKLTLSSGTDAAKRYKRVDWAIAVIWKMLMIPSTAIQASERPLSRWRTSISARNMRMDSSLTRRLRLTYFRWDNLSDRVPASTSWRLAWPSSASYEGVAL